MLCSSTLQTAEHMQKAFHVYVTDIQTDPTCNSCHHYKQSNIPNRYCIFTLQKVKHTHCNWQFMTTLQSQTNPSGNACLHYRQSHIPNRQFMSTIYSHSPTYPSGNSYRLMIENQCKLTVSRVLANVYYPKYKCCLNICEGSCYILKFYCWTGGVTYSPPGWKMTYCFR